MCGVIGFTSERQRDDLGRIAAELLKTLEYRGYDSTGAAVQGEGEQIVLRKGVGAPSLMVEKLGIVGLAGSILCGQVRWATFGSVDDVNAQPHEMRCKTHLYGAHNGNVTNCDDLKAWLTAEGHAVLSDNDGEMVVHTVEHFFAAGLAGSSEPRDGAARRRCMRAAILQAAARLRGSYAAVVVDPVSRTLWALKQGSSLYFGFGRDAAGGRFAIASSDLSSVLKLTRVLVPLSEGEFVEYTPEAYQVHAMKDRGAQRAGETLARQPLRSRLQAKDAALLPQYACFMEQEIAAQEDTCRRIAALFARGSEASQRLLPYVDAWAGAQRTPGSPRCSGCATSTTTSASGSASASCWRCLAGRSWWPAFRELYATRGLTPRRPSWRGGSSASRPACSRTCWRWPAPATSCSPCVCST